MRDRLAGRLAPRRRGRRGRAALHRPRRRAPLQDGSRRRSSLDQTGPVRVRTGAGDVSVERATGRRRDHDRLRALSRSAASTGRQWSRTPTATPGSATLRATSARTPPTAGSPSTDRGRPSSRSPANGDILLGAVAQGEVVAETGFGKVDIGVVDGVAAWLELKTKLRQRAQRARGRRQSRAGRGRGRDPRPHRLRRHHDPPLHRRSDHERKES